jgi:hypothetical protein
VSSGNGESDLSAAAPMPTAQLSAFQRSEQTDRMIAQIQALTAQGNALVQSVNGHTAAIVALTQQQGVTFNSLAEFCGRGFLQRVRWLVTGR